MQSFPQRLGTALGIFAGGIHLVWVILVALGAAQPLVDWILTLHSIKPFYQILPFDLGTAALLVVVTTCVGFVFGFVLGTIWKKVTAR